MFSVQRVVINRAPEQATTWWHLEGWWVRRNENSFGVIKKLFIVWVIYCFVSAKLKSCFFQDVLASGSGNRLARRCWTTSSTTGCRGTTPSAMTGGKSSARFLSTFQFLKMRQSPVLKVGCHKTLSFAGLASGKHQLCPPAEPRGEHPLGRRQVGHNPQNLATKPFSPTGIKQLPRALKNKVYRIYRNICIYRALYNVSREIYRSEKEFIIATKRLATFEY